MSTPTYPLATTPAEAIEHKPSLTPVPYGPDLGWSKSQNQGPSFAYVEVDDLVLWETWATTAAITLYLSIRILRADGTIVPALGTISTNANTVTPVTRIITVPSGFILSATVQAPGAGHGQAFTRVSIQRGQGTGDVTRGNVLVAGTCSQFSLLGYPEVPVTPALSGFGQVVYQPVANPAAGADWTFSIPAGLGAIVRSVRAQLVTSASAGTRLARIQVTDGSHIPVDAAAGGTQAASLTDIYCWAPGITAQALVGPPAIINAGLPRELRLNAGYSIQTATQNIQAGDQWSLVAIDLEYWFAN